MSSWLKIGRANELFNTLKRGIEGWMGTNPYAVTTKHDAEGRRHSLVLNISSPPPLERWSLIAGDCVHNLRGSLDHLVYALAIRHMGNENFPKYRMLQFPILDSPEKFDEWIEKLHWNAPGTGVRTTSISSKTREFLERAQPYNRRHSKLPHQLTILNEFSNSDKHRLLNITFTHLVDGKIDFMSRLPGGGPDIYWRRTAVPESGAEIAFFSIDPPQPDVDYKYHVTLQITVKHLPGPNGVDASPLLRTLAWLTAEVTSTLDAARASAV